MHIIVIIAGAIVGGLLEDVEGALLGVVLGYLGAEVVALRRRLKKLEEEVKRSAAAGDAVVFEPVEEVVEPTGAVYTGAAMPEPQPRPAARAVRGPGAISGHEAVSAVDTLFARIGGLFGGIGDGLTRFVTGGNLVLKMGLVVLFFGVAFFVKYAAQQNLVPIEFRLAGAAMGGLVLLGLGWRLRARSGGYGLGLQGGGVGILYLVVYGAARLYELVPMELALILMVAVVVLSGLLAVIQNARMLASFGVVGGFLAPVLMSTGGGSHVLLFSYYALLNLGIFGIAWYKAWRELNLLGFFFTFGVATLWGSKGYRPEHFSTTEPFLILFFLFYVTISVLFAHRQPVNLRGYIDGPLVFGLPLVATGLQYALVRDMEYGMAVSACGLGIFYLLLATLLWKRLAEGMRMLCEAFLALGVMFATMTIPLALDPEWSSAVWALEGGAMVWVGVRQQRLLARLFGILLQFGAAWMFIAETFYPFGAMPFLNRYFFGCLFLAVAALFSNFWLIRGHDELRRWERYLTVPLLVWGMCWWYYGGLRECDLHLTHLRFANALLLFGAASTIVMTIVAARSKWRQLAIAQATLLVVIGLSLLGGLLDLPSNSHLLAGYGAVAWSVAFYCQYRMLRQFDELWPRWLAGSWHVATFWLLLLLGCLELFWLIDVVLELRAGWIRVVLGLVPALAVTVLLALGDKPQWPLGLWHRWYRGVGIGLPVALLAVWSLFAVRWAGDPAPLPYIPFINPLEMVLLFILLVLLRWVRGCVREFCYLPARLAPATLYWIIALLVFVFLNGVVARLVHFWGNIPYHSDALFHSVVFQASLSALWSFGALSLTVWATRRGSRLVWCCGAALLGSVVVKLFLVDLSGTGTVARIVSFIVVGILMLVIGYFSPMPPGVKEDA